MSTFSYLKAMRVDYVKIDGSFVRSILADPMDAAVVEAINRVAHIAGVQTIAECVESESVLNELKELNIDYAQGYAAAPPGPSVFWVSAYD